MNKKIILSALYITILLLYGNIISKPYKGAELRTHTSYLHGRFEVRMKSTVGSGMLSSFFTYHDGTNLPANWNEIDIEILGRYTDREQFNVISPGQVDHVFDYISDFNPHQAFHVYAFEWTPDYVAWSVDGYEVYRQTDSHIQELIHSQKIMMNIWLPDYPSWVGPFNPAILPVYAYYDWVKYYSYTPGTGDNFTLQWEDDFSNWNQSRWGKGTHTWWGNNCDFITQNAVFQNGYFILCLTDDTNLGYSGAPIVDVDIDAPYLIWARNFETYIDIAFSESLDSVSAQTVSNYNIPGLNINNAILKSDQRTVRLLMDSLNTTINYNLIVSGINDLAQPANTMSISFIIVNTPLQFPLKINVGGNVASGYIADQEWNHEQEYGRIGGTIINHSPGTNFQGTTEPEIYENELRDLTFYNIRIADGTYRVTLMMAETQHNASNQRVFDIYAEGQKYFDDVDIYNEVGSFTANEKIINNVHVNDGILQIYFDEYIGETVLSGIKIEKILTYIKPKSNIPEKFKWNIFPNPFNSSLSIKYLLNRPANTEINIYNIMGQFVKNIFKKQQNSGNHKYNYSADELSTGMYFIEINIDGIQMDVQKAICLK